MLLVAKVIDFRPRNPAPRYAYANTSYAGFKVGELPLTVGRTVEVLDERDNKYTLFLPLWILLTCITAGGMFEMWSTVQKESYRQHVHNNCCITSWLLLPARRICDAENVRYPQKSVVKWVYVITEELVNNSCHWDSVASIRGIAMQLLRSLSQR